MRITGILLFFLVLCLPGIQSIKQFVPPHTIDENRTMAAHPTLADFKDPVAGFLQFEKYFNDHYGLRDILIRLKTQIDFSVFRTSDRVHLGKDGWLFYRSVLDVEKPATERYFRANSTHLTAGIEDLATGLKQRGQTLVLMPLFLGDVYYPEMLPRDVPDLPSPSAFARATKQWQHLPNLIYIDAAAVLMPLKKQRQIFHKTDFHWNSPAAFEVGRKLVDRLGEDSRAKLPVWDHTLKIDRRFYIGRESDFLPLFRQPSEQGLFVEPTWDTDAVTYQKDQGIFEYISTKRVHDERTLPSLCLVGDSFSDALLEAGFTSYFSHVYRVRWKGADTLPSALAAFPPDCRYVMIEFIETQAPAFVSMSNGAANLPTGRQGN